MTDEEEAAAVVAGATARATENEQHTGGFVIFNLLFVVDVETDIGLRGRCTYIKSRRTFLSPRFIFSVFVNVEEALDAYECIFVLHKCVWTCVVVHIHNARYAHIFGIM